MRGEVDVPRLLDRLGVEYRRQGRALRARCPYPGHDEREPSWSVVDDPGGDRHGLDHCFGCKRGGTPRDLVAAVLGVDERAAEEWLRSGEVLRERDLPDRVVVRVLRAPPAFALPDGVLLVPVTSWPTPARDYLARRRVPDAQAERWGLGYAVDGRLAMRVVVPVRDAAGRLRSYVARSFVERVGGREAKRYLEPRGDEGADHSAVVGEHLWPRAGRDLALVAEGWFDGAALERAAALLGQPAAPAVLHGSPSPGCDGWDSVAGKLATFRRLAVAVDPNAAGERLLDSLRGSLGRYCEVLAVRADLDAAAVAERRGDAELARLLAGALGRRSISGDVYVSEAGKIPA